jgi:hypothetical protein
MASTVAWLPQFCALVLVRQRTNRLGEDQTPSHLVRRGFHSGPATNEALGGVINSATPGTPSYRPMGLFPP